MYSCVDDNKPKYCIGKDLCQHQYSKKPGKVWETHEDKWLPHDVECLTICQSVWCTKWFSETFVSMTVLSPQKVEQIHNGWFCKYNNRIKVNCYLSIQPDFFQPINNSKHRQTNLNKYLCQPMLQISNTPFSCEYTSIMSIS